MLNWEKLSFLLACGTVLASAGIAIWTWLHNRHTAGMEEVEALGDRVSKLEIQMHHLPNPEALSRLQIGIEGRLSSLEASLKAAQYTLGRIESHFISNDQ